MAAEKASAAVDVIYERRRFDPTVLPQIAAALERWVEEGAAPKEIIATKFKSGANSASGVLRTRPLCPYPQTASYKGSGSTDDAANFVCK